MSTDPYDIVLRDLRVQRDNIDAAIKAIETVRGKLPRVTEVTSESLHTASPSPPESSSTGELASVAQSNQGPYVGLTIYDAAIKALRAHGQAMTNIDLANAIQAGGVKLNAADPYNTVGSVLTRRFFDQGDVVRVGRGTWGLPEWYPDRDFRAEALAKRADKKSSAATDSDAQGDQPDNDGASPDAAAALNELLYGPPSSH